MSRARRTTQTGRLGPRSAVIALAPVVYLSSTVKRPSFPLKPERIGKFRDSLPIRWAARKKLSSFDDAPRYARLFGHRGNRSESAPAMTLRRPSREHELPD